MHDEIRGYVYIITNRPCGVLYTGVTSQLVQRIYQHKHKLVEGFSKRYNLDKIVYYEMFDLVTDASIAQSAWVEGEDVEKPETAKVHSGFR